MKNVMIWDVVVTRAEIWEWKVQPQMCEFAWQLNNCRRIFDSKCILDKEKNCVPFFLSFTFTGDNRTKSPRSYVLFNMSDIQPLSIHPGQRMPAIWLHLCVFCSLFPFPFLFSFLFPSPSPFPFALPFSRCRLDFLTYSSQFLQWGKKISCSSRAGNSVLFFFGSERKNYNIF